MCSILPPHTCLLYFGHVLTDLQNTVAVDPTGKSYCSGGEDGYVRVHHFDKGYFDFLYEAERERLNRSS